MISFTLKAMKPDEIRSGLLKGDPYCLAKAISLVENRRPGYRQLLASLDTQRKPSLKIGVTGAPGSGKSSLIDRLIDHLKKQGLVIGILAVDPSSPITGGALLGDRIRMVRHSNDANVFIRSLASRGHLGGLANSAFEIVELLEAAGKDIIIIETVGIGQSEIEVVNIADVVLMVLTPASGDEIQILKAGIIEVADIFVINKADLGGADTKIAEIHNYFYLSGKMPPVVATSAQSGLGIEELARMVFSFQDENQDRIQAKKESFKKNLVLKILEEKIREDVQRHKHIAPLLEKIKDHNPFHVAEAIYRQFKSGGKSDSED